VLGVFLAPRSWVERYHHGTATLWTRSEFPAAPPRCCVHGGQLTQSPRVSIGRSLKAIWVRRVTKIGAVAENTEHLAAEYVIERTHNAMAVSLTATDALPPLRLVQSAT
jgi:hypothetical protein